MGEDGRKRKNKKNRKCGRVKRRVKKEGTMVFGRKKVEEAEKKR